jgi:sugar-specific transcriptional regulator TrmB
MNLISIKEKRILDGLYTLENASVGELAKDAQINRTTLYPILEDLLKRGLITKSNIEGRASYQPISVADFHLWLKNEERKGKKEIDNYKKWIGNKKYRSGPALLSDFRYYEGEEGVKNLYADTWRNNKGKIIYAITDYHGAYDTLGDFFIHDYFPQRIRHEVKVKNLIPESPEGKRDLKHAKKLLREVRFLEIFEDLDIEINIYDNKVAIAAFDKKLPSGVLIKNQKIAEAMKKIFNHLWKITKRI